jgi:hypothetical protein
MVQWGFREGEKRPNEYAKTKRWGSVIKCYWLFSIKVQLNFPKKCTCHLCGLPNETRDFSRGINFPSLNSASSPLRCCLTILFPLFVLIILFFKVSFVFLRGLKFVISFRHRTSSSFLLYESDFLPFCGVVSWGEETKLVYSPSSQQVQWICCFQGVSAILTIWTQIASYFCQKSVFSLPNGGYSCF